LQPQKPPSPVVSLGGQNADVPVQLSATSHSKSLGGRHTSPAERNPSAGQTSEEPVHASATSHVAPIAAARHTKPAARR
jgi:hypothetical protein